MEEKTKHDELMALVNPLIDFMMLNEYNYLLIAGKDGICTRQLRGERGDLFGMLTDMMAKNNEVCDLFSDTIKTFIKTKE